MDRDKQVFELIQKELTRQQNGLELIASENFTSKQVMEAMGHLVWGTISFLILVFHFRLWQPQIQLLAFPGRV